MPSSARRTIGSAKRGADPLPPVDDISGPSFGQQQQNLASTAPTSSPPAPRKTRTRTGCLNCRRKKRKCDEDRPACGACRRRDQICEWGIRLSFRQENAQTIDSQHPSMARASKRSKPSEYSILNVTEEVIRDYVVTPTDEPHAPKSSVRRLPSPSDHPSADSRTTIAQSPALPATPSAAINKKDKTPPASSQHVDSAVASLLYLRKSGHPILSPDQCALQLNTFSQGYIQTMQVFTPDGGSADDGIFLPGSAYHEWHSTLRNHLIQEVRSTVPTRAGTPHHSHIDSSNHSVAASQDETASASSADLSSQQRIAVISDSLSSAEPESPVLPSLEECTLWRNWFDEVSPWLDKFDNQRHFQHILPTMAHQHPHLRLSILALSARQMELKGDAMTSNRSLSLYQEAIHQLLPHLPDRDTAVIASCVILCVLEMLSCSPKAWQRHLDGCASLMEAVGINGFAGGVEQALFWCFARMDVCGGLISSVKTLIPVSHWASGADLAADSSAFVQIADFCGWANYSVYLLAQVIDLLMPDNSSAARQRPDTEKESQRGALPLTNTEFVNRWTQLWHYICDWLDRRPAPLLPTMTIPSSNPAAPFPTIIFSNPAAISSNQLYHTASLLMLQNQPLACRNPVPKPRSILWHARRVCAISISNDHHGAWTNAIQPLWIAGRCMSNPTEHKAILTLLERIEKESGWGTRWRADDLKAFWGDLEE